jgi:flagellar motor switch protein FliG
MDIRRKISRAYSSGTPDDGTAPKPVVRPAAWKQFSQVPAAVPPAGSKEEEVPLPRGLLKTGPDGDGTKKAAKFLLLLGKDDAASIMRHLSEDELLRVSSAMAGIRTVSKPEADALLREFGFLKVPPHTSSGGLDVARSLLTEAFGPEKASAVLKRALPFGGEKPFSFLEEYEAHQIASILKKESVRVISVVLRFLSPKRSSAVLQSLPVPIRVEALRRMGRMERIDTDALERMQAAIREKIRSQGKLVTQEVDGPAALAAILKHLSLDHEEQLLQNIEEADPELGRELKEKVYTLDLILNVADKELQEVLRTHPDEEIARMIKGRDMRVREKITHNLSTRRREMVEEEILRLGSIPKREADAAAREFLDYLLTLSDQGLVHFRDREEHI